MGATAIHPEQTEPWLSTSRSRSTRGELAPETLLYLRPELRFTPYRESNGQERWVVHDPVTRASYRIGAAEYRILQFCSEKRSVSEVVRRAVRSPAEENPSAAAIGGAGVVATLQRLRAFRLLHTQGPQVPTESNRWAWTRWLSSAVVWRMPGINIDPILSRVARVTDVLFSATAVRLWLSLFAIVACLTLCNGHRLFAELPLGAELTTQATGVWILIFIFTRAAHELGHAIVCRRFGIRCPDIGFLFIIGTPCLYCDVSESWQLVERWKRAAVAAAGMYVELIIATLALAFWLGTDGASSQIALQVACVCSVSTVLINGNPLMRFDGYHILADWCDEANLRGKADAEAFRVMADIVLGPVNVNQPRKLRLQASNSSEVRRALESPADGRSKVWYRRFLAAFSVASWGYRAMLSLAICGALVAVYSRWNLPWIGRGIAAMVLIGMWGTSLWQFARALRFQAKTRFRKLRWWVFCWLVALIIMFVPIPQRQSGHGWVQPRELHGVFASHDARLVSCNVSEQAPVAEGQAIFRLSAPDLELNAIEKQSAAQIAKLHLNRLRRERDVHGERVELAMASSAAESAEQLASNAQESLQSLKVTSPGDGVFYGAEAPKAKSPTLPSEESLPTSSALPQKWSSHDQKGRVVPKGTLLGTVIGHERFVVVPLSRGQLEKITEGARAKLLLSGSNQQVVESKVLSIVSTNDITAKLLTPYFELSRNRNAAAYSNTGTASDASGNFNHQFAALVPLPDYLSPVVGSGVDVAFHLPSKTAFGALKTWAYGNLRFLSD